MPQHRVGILGATGLVGQRLIQRLEGHPWFHVQALAASARSAGRPYREAVDWTLSADPPSSVRDLEVRPCTVDALDDCEILLSGLDTATGTTFEPELAAAGHVVVSNCSAHRLAEDVPLLIPEVNAGHLAIARRQHGEGGGFIVTNPNCSVTGLALALAPLHRRFGIERLVVATFQALSGAGASGPRAMQFVDNVVPFIPGEEDKMELELSKLFAELEGETLRAADVRASAHCHRVATLDGHLEAVSFELRRPADVPAIVETLRAFEGEATRLDLPSAPVPPIVVRDEDDRPQPRLDRMTGGGMAVTVGRVRTCSALGFKLELLSHNTLRGAAGATVLNAELIVAADRLPQRSR